MSHMFRALIPTLIGARLLTGCSSPFALFYDPASNSHSSAVTQQAVPLLAFSRNPDRDGKRLAREGYVLVGTSSFVTGDADLQLYKEQLMTQGTKVGAAVVLLNVDYADVTGDSNCCIRVVATYWAHSMDE